MELNTTRAVITAAEPMGSILQEQGVELDYVLPDYYPDVCKLVKCFVTPSVTSQSISSGRLSYELCCEVRILYCSEDSHVLQCVTQTLRFPRTAELPAGEELTAEILPAADYVNCRAVSRRRLDVRGAVTIRIRPSGVRMQEALSDAAGSGLQLRRIPVQYPERTIRTSKSILLSEELELGAAKPPVLHVVRCDARAVDLMQKRVSGKLMVNGSLQLQILYACEKDGRGPYGEHRRAGVQRRAVPAGLPGLPPGSILPRLRGRGRRCRPRRNRRHGTCRPGVRGASRRWCRPDSVSCCSQ